MPGVFSKTARPVRPGAYFDWLAEPQQNVLPNIGRVVCIAATHDWGPVNTVISTTSFADWQSKFGPTASTQAYGAVKDAFVGEGLSGRGGAGVVLFYRLAASAATAASVTLQNTTPVNALTLTAVYPGSYGQALSASVQTNALDNTLRDLVISLNGSVVETFTYQPGQIAALAATINAQSRWVTANELVDGVALQAVTGVSFAGANDGTALIAGDFTTMMGTLGTARFGYFALGDIASTTSWNDASGNSILTSLLAWQKSLNLAGKRFTTAIGGTLTDAVSESVSRSALANDPNVINIGASSVVDAERGNLSSSQLAPRVAGILSQRGEDKSLTYSRLAGTAALTLPSESAILQAFNGGVVVLSQDSNPDSPLRVEKGLTTYVGGDSTKPYIIYRNPKFVATMHNIEIELTEWAAFNAIGQLQVNNNTRAYIVGYAKSVMKARSERGVIQDGATVSVDPDPPPSDQDEFVALVYGIAFGRSVEQIFNTVYMK